MCIPLAKSNFACQDSVFCISLLLQDNPPTALSAFYDEDGGTIYAASITNKVIFIFLLLSLLLYCNLRILPLPQLYAYPCLPHLFHSVALS